MLYYYAMLFFICSEGEQMSMKNCSLAVYTISKMREKHKKYRNWQQ